MNQEKTYCQKCKNDTNQVIVFNETELDTKEFFFPSLNGEPLWAVEKKDWLLYKCNGCEKINLKIKTYHIGKNGIENKVNTFIYPSKVNRIPPSWIFSLEQNYIELLSEIYSAFNNNSYTLVSIGIRTLFDMYITSKTGDTGTFKNKIDKFTNEGYINSSQKKLLITLIEAGNASAHRGYKTNKKTLSTLLEISEHLLQTEVLEDKSKAIHNKIPRRKV